MVGTAQAAEGAFGANHKPEAIHPHEPAAIDPAFLHDDRHLPEGSEFDDIIWLE